MVSDARTLREKNILVIGGHGMLGRPVVRRLRQEGFRVRLAARRPADASRHFSGAIDIVAADLADAASLDAALQGCQFVYLSVDTRHPDGFRPETAGLKNLVTAARNHNTPRLLLLSILGGSTPEAKTHSWWHLREKHEAQLIAQRSGLPWTIFEPTWFMESLPLFVKKRKFAAIGGARFRPYWIAGDDYARMIAVALDRGLGVGEIIPVQGREAMTLEEAGRVFLHAYDPSICVAKIPFAALRLAALFNAEAKELATLIRVSNSFVEPPPNPEVWARYAAPQMTAADYATYVRATGDFPQK